MTDPLGSIGNNGQNRLQPSNLPEVTHHEGKTWRYLKKGGEIFIGLFTKRIYVSLGNNKIKLGKYKKSGEQRTGLVITYGLRNAIGLGEYKPYIQVFREVKSYVSGGGNSYEILEQGAVDDLIDQIQKKEGVAFQNLFNEEGLLSSEWNNIDEQTAVGMLLQIFDNINRTITDNEAPIETKKELLNIVIDWAKRDDLPKLREYRNLIDLANMISENASKSNELQGCVRKLNNSLNLLEPKSLDARYEKIASKGHKNKDVKDVARAFHLTYMDLYKNIRVDHIKEKLDDNNTIKPIVDFFNKTTLSIVQSMLTGLEDHQKGENQKVMINMLNFFTDLAQEAYNNGDLSTAYSVYSGLSNTAIDRIIRHDYLNEKIGIIKAKIDVLKNLLSLADNMNALRRTQEAALTTYRSHKNASSLPPIPHIGVFLKDQANTNDLVGENKNIQIKANLEKLVSFLKEIENLQYLPQASLKTISEAGSPDENDLHQRSLRHFPRA